MPGDKVYAYISCGRYDWSAYIQVNGVTVDTYGDSNDRNYCNAGVKIIESLL